jgi:AcrR family transcriptional regulator
VFAARGLDATLDDVAHHAGLGVGTAYRHFPNKHALIEGLFDDRLATFIAFAEVALTNPDPGAGFAAAMVRLGEDLAEVRGLRDLLLRPGGMGPPPRAHDLDRVMGALLERAQADGSIRSDITVADLPTLVAMTDAATERNPDRWRLFLGVILDGLAVNSVGAPHDDGLDVVADEYLEET